MSQGSFGELSPEFSPTPREKIWKKHVGTGLERR